MELLSDLDLVRTLAPNVPDPQPVLQDPRPPLPYVEGVKPPADWYGQDSPVQASSIDLHIGAIYLPGTKETAAGEAPTKTDHVLKTGETAVVTTSETLHLPTNVAGIGFPPSSVSFRGLLMTNPGHVDPGYNGQLRFTVINMGKVPYPLSTGNPIVTLLLFRLSGNVRRGWAYRHDGAKGGPTQKDVNRLSKDFVDVDRRATSIARSQGIQWSVGITAGVALLGAILSLLSSGQLFHGKDIEELKSKQIELKNKQAELETRMNWDQNVQALKDRIKKLEEAKASPKPGTK